MIARIPHEVGPNRFGYWIGVGIFFELAKILRQTGEHHVLTAVAGPNGELHVERKAWQFLEHINESGNRVVDVPHSTFDE